MPKKKVSRKKVKAAKKTFLGKLLSKKKRTETVAKPAKKLSVPSQEEISQFIVSLAEKKDIKYSLIGDMAFADIKWEEDEKQFIYYVREPEFSKDEQKTYDKMVSGLMEILDVELSAIKKKEEAQKKLVELSSFLDKAVSKGVYHRNTASRKKSRMHHLLSGLKA